MSTQTQWLSPAPLWNELSNARDTTPFRRPVILRFATDNFMPQLQSVLMQTPQTLRDYVAQGETWRSPAAGLGSPTTLALKLYQPPQARFYVIASSLTCRMPGLPDHTVNKSVGESVAFVVRQLRPNPGFSSPDLAVFDPSKCTEYAWIAGQQPGWTPATAAGLATGEEQIPLAPSRTAGNGTTRRLYIGLIPASRRQQYIGGNTLKNANANGGGNSATDPRTDLFNRQVVAPWTNLQTWWTALTSAEQGAGPDQTSDYQSSALVLVDFANFLATYLAQVWAAIQDASKVGQLNAAELALYNAIGPPLGQALANAFQFSSQLDSASAVTPFPPAGYVEFSLATSPLDPTAIASALAAALPALGSVNPPPPTLPPISQKPANPAGDFYFIVRCVYLRPQCRQTIVSDPSQPFLLASYFDSDAPARRIQIALPVDTSPSALRKYDKGVAFLISQELRNQMERMQSLQQMSDGSPDPMGIDIGMICSFSIPIITICALMLLLVIVIALNLVFFWIPFFKICFPVPTLKGE